MTITATSAEADVLNAHDSAKYREERVGDPGINFNSEDEYRITRPRYTRVSPRRFTLGYTFITDADKQLLEGLWVKSKGGSEEITGFVDPIDQSPVTIRFKRGTIPKFKYRGRGGAHYWDVSNVILEEI